MYRDRASGVEGQPCAAAVAAGRASGYVVELL